MLMLPKALTHYSVQIRVTIHPLQILTLIHPHKSSPPSKATTPLPLQTHQLMTLKLIALGPTSSRHSHIKHIYRTQPLPAMCFPSTAAQSKR
jgi:hypothetical protein